MLLWFTDSMSFNSIKGEYNAYQCFNTARLIVCVRVFKSDKNDYPQEFICTHGGHF